MKRFVTYLYEYDRGSRGRNTGFVRTDIRENSCRMEIHIRGLDRQKGKSPIYLVIAENEPIGIASGEILLSQGTGNGILSFPDQRIGPSPYVIDQLLALVIRLGNGKLLAACFVKEPAAGILEGKFSCWMPESAVMETAVSAPPAPSQETVSSELPAADSENTPSSLTDTAPEDTPSNLAASSVEPPEVSFRRIELTDIRSLPRRNWYLSNNRFVVHGFFNYHYLLLKTVKLPEGRKRYLGVPGIYEQPERMMALLFGFPEFELSEEAKRSRPQPDADLTGAFGYWMCPVSEE